MKEWVPQIGGLEPLTNCASDKARVKCSFFQDFLGDILRLEDNAQTKI